MNETNTSIELSSSNGTLSIEMNSIYRAEGRIRDIAFVNKETAPELLAVLSEGYSDLSRAFGKVHYLVGKLEIEKKRRKAVLTLDIIPVQAKERGLTSGRSPTGSEDVREAFYYSDDEYVKLEDNLAAADATKELLGIKLRSLWMAIDSIKAIIKDSRALPVMGHVEQGYSLESPMAPGEKPTLVVKPRVIIDEAEKPKLPTTRFGKPKHD